jgi:hypothetical protein
MMVTILLFIFMLLLPASSEAAYNIYLKNGSVISGVSSYERKGGEVIIHFGAGSMGVPEAEILKIEETGAPEMELRPKEATEVKAAPSEAPAVDRYARTSALRSDLDAIDTQLKEVEENEARVKASIDEKRGKRYKYNVYQLRKLESELEPLQQELLTIRQKKRELLDRKASTEGELRALE